MMKIVIAIFIWICLGVPTSIFGQELPVIPCPVLVAEQSGECLLKKGKIGFSGPELLPEASFLQEKLAGLSVPLKVEQNSKKAMILLSLRSDIQGDGAYRLRITPRQVVIEGSSRSGIFYGVQTLLQLVKNQGCRLKCVDIQDQPRYAWRGFMLDEARHFFGKAKVKQILDLMAYYKLNKFHWHLTDEQGWRIEIKKYPRLSAIGGLGNWSSPEGKEACFYTQEDIREIVAYAARRHIEVIPEIDMPGHATASNRAYPEYSGGGTREHPDFTFNVGKEETYTFLTNVLREVAGLFPAPYLHIGGDEVAYGIEAWKTDPDVQAMMKREGLGTVKEAERYFMRRMADTVRVIGKTLVGWDELLDLDIPADRSVIMWWRHDRVNQLKKSLQGGYSTVMCPRRPLYFDFIQHESHKWGRVWSGFCPLEDVYAFPDKGMATWQISSEQLGNIRGIQANVWTERIQDARRLDFMLFPRMCALAEAAWTLPDMKNYESFTKRMDDAYRDFDQIGIYYFDARNPGKHEEPVGAQQQKKDVPMDFRD